MLAGQRVPWWIPIGAVLLALLYLPTLATRFDFIDDGNLVYPTRPMPIGERLGVVWGKIAANYEHLGPFRPTLWLHWELEADLFAGNAFAWRLARLCWCALAAGMFLWLMHELRLSRWASLLAAALAMWNPFRNEIWTSLTLAEGVAMPYALLALVAALRAGRADGRWSRFGWEITALIACLVALGCKNVFVALVPVQIALRLCPEGWNPRENWRQHGWRSCVLALPIVPFAIHFVYFKLNWHPGQYQPPGPSLAQLARYLNALKGAISLDFLGLGLATALCALVARGSLRAIWRNHSSAVVTALLLLLGGIALYVQMDGISGRYTMPAVWGLDILIAVVLSETLALPALWWKRAAIGAFAVGLVAVAGANVGRQQRFAARADMLWQALKWVERQPAAEGTTVAWISDSAADSAAGKTAYLASNPGLNIEEGIHFGWHLQARGRAARVVELFDETGRRLKRVEIGAPDVQKPTLLITAFAGPPAEFGTDWQKKESFETVYALGMKRYRCSIWVRSPHDATIAQGAASARSAK